MKFTIQDPKTKNFYGPGEEDAWLCSCKTSPHFFPTFNEAKTLVETFSVPPRAVLEIRTEDGELAAIYPTYGKDWFTFII